MSIDTSQEGSALTNAPITEMYVEHIETPTFQPGQSLQVPDQDDSPTIPVQVQPDVAPDSDFERTAEAEVKEEPQPQQDFSRQFHALSKKEREIRQMELQARDKIAQAEKFERSRALAQQDPLKFLEENGLSMEKLISRAIGEDEPSPQQQLDQRTAQIEAKIREFEEAAQKHQAQMAEQQRLAQKKSLVDAATAYVNQNPERYELIKANKVEGEVWELIEKTYLETNGQVKLDYERAADLIEKQLETETEKQIQHVENLKKLKKLQQKFGPSQGRLAPQPDSTKIETIPVARTSLRTQTLTNNAVVAGLPAEQLTGDALHRYAASLIRFTDD